MATRQVVVDDTSERVLYSGAGWFLDQGSQDNFGIYGPEYNHTLHGTSTANAGIALKFNGTSIRVYGSMNSEDQRTPTWECFLDQKSIGSLPPLATSEHDNNFILCDVDQMADGEHLVTVNVTSSGTTFWFDYFVYTPSPGASLDSAVLRVQNEDPAFQFGSGWSDFGGIAGMTSTPGSQLNFTFTGTSATMVGVTPNGNTSSATYTVDDQPPITFTLTGHSNSQDNWFNQVFFTTPSLSPGKHTVVVTYIGANGTIPLIADYLYITTSPPAQPSSSPTPSSTPLSTSSNHSSSLGAIIGGVIGGLALLAFIVAGILLWQRRRRRYMGPRGIIDAPGDDYAGVASVSPPSPSIALPIDPYPVVRQTPGGSVIGSVMSPYSDTVYNDTSVGTRSFVPSLRSVTSPTGSTGTAIPLTSRKSEQALVAQSAAPVRQPIVHSDSGLRFNQEETEDLIELPPVYAAE